MKRLLGILFIAAGLILTPLAYDVQAATDAGSSAAPSVGQPLVREGDFALALVGKLDLGKTEDEAAAEDILSSASIAPKNGWVADYPVTPDIVAELQDAAGSAADAGQVKMTRAEAIRAVQTVTTEAGLEVVQGGTSVLGEETQYSSNPPAEGESDYPDSTVVNNYYSDYGPPAVTYYTPPWDYSYLYGWVPYPFWYGSSFFPGFFVLHDFHRFAHVRFFNGRFHHGFSRFHNRHSVSNHVVNRINNRVSVINAARRAAGGRAMFARHNAANRGFTSHAARAGARSIMTRNSRSFSANRGRAENGTRFGLNSAAGRAGLSTRGGGRFANIPNGHRFMGGSRGTFRNNTNFRSPGFSRGMANGGRSFSGRSLSGANRSFAVPRGGRSFGRSGFSGGRSFSVGSSGFSRGGFRGGSFHGGGFRGGGFHSGGFRGGGSRGGSFHGGGSHGGGFHGGGRGGGRR